MQILRRIVLAGGLLAGLLVPFCQPAQAQKLRDSGHCVLKNLQAHRELYNGECRISQEKTDYGVLMTFKMGEAQSFKIACDKNGRNCMTGPTNVQMQDRGNGSASFRWEAFQLDVDADQQAPAQSQQAQAQKLRDSGRCVLKNLQARRELYNGDCRISQENTSTGVLMTFKMGEAQSFKVACDKNGRNCMTGPTPVQMRDRGNGSASFRWETFQLDVDAN
jgi:hypothetical protein